MVKVDEEELDETEAQVEVKEMVKVADKPI